MSRDELECVVLERLWVRQATKAAPHGTSPEFNRWLYQRRTIRIVHSASPDTAPLRRTKAASPPTQGLLALAYVTRGACTNVPRSTRKPSRAGRRLTCEI